MNTLEVSVTAIAFSVCVLCILLSKQFRHPVSLAFFIAYLSLEALGFVFEWLLVHPDSSFKALWLGSYMALSFLMAPCLWLFAVETSTNSRPSLYQLSLIEKSIILIGILLTLPLMLAAHPGKLMSDPEYPAVGITANIIHETMLLCIGLFLFQVPWYLHKCLTIIRAHSQRDFALFSNIDDMPLNTLRVLIWVMAGNWILGFLRTLRELLFDGPSYFNVLLTCCEAGITCWAVYVILKRCFLPASLQPTPVVSFEDAQVINNKDDANEKYAKSPLDEAIRERIEKKLRLALEVDQLFKQSNLKLRDLCDHINESTHYVSQVINQFMGTSFYELINHYRIEAAKTKLLNNKENILDIAMEVGFNSKSTFNLAFKRMTGCTPKEYKELNS